MTVLVGVAKGEVALVETVMVGKRMRRDVETQAPQLVEETRRMTDTGHGMHRLALKTVGPAVASGASRRWKLFASSAIAHSPVWASPSVTRACTC